MGEEKDRSATPLFEIHATMILECWMALEGTRVKSLEESIDGLWELMTSTS